MWRYSTLLHQTLQVTDSRRFRILSHGLYQRRVCKRCFVVYTVSAILHCRSSVVTSIMVTRVPLLLMGTGNYDVCQLTEYMSDSG